MSWGVWGWLFVSVGVCCRLLAYLVSWDVWEVSGKMPGGWSEWYSWKLELLWCGLGVSGFLALAVWSRNTILAQPWKAWLFSSDHTEISKYQNVHIWGWQKRLGFMIFLFLSARQKDLKNGSCTWTPCSTGPAAPTFSDFEHFYHIMHSLPLYRVFMCNCHFLYLSDGHLKTKKS